MCIANEIATKFIENKTNHFINVTNFIIFSLRNCINSSRPIDSTLIDHFICFFCVFFSLLLLLVLTIRSE